MDVGGGVVAQEQWMGGNVLICRRSREVGRRGLAADTQGEEKLGGKEEKKRERGSCGGNEDWKRGEDWLLTASWDGGKKKLSCEWKRGNREGGNKLTSKMRKLWVKKVWAQLTQGWLLKGVL